MNNQVRRRGSWRRLGALVGAGALLATVTVASSGSNPALASSASGLPARSHPNPAGALAWFANQRRTPGVTSPAAYASAQADAVNTAKAEQGATAQRFAAAGVAQPVWQPIGPAPLVQTPPDPTQNVSGRVITIATTGSGSSEKLFIGPAAGGVWSSTLSSSPTWATHTDFQPSLAEGAVAVAPSNPSIVYSGTGEDDSGADAFWGEGLLASSNGGSSWVAENPGGTFTGQTISGVAVDPANASHLYVSGSAGFFTSTDGGQTVTAPTTITYPAGSTNVSGMVVDPANFATLFAAVPGVGIERSTDGGDTFSVLGGGLPAGATFGNTTLAISPNGQSVYAEIQGLSGSNSIGTLVYRTTNGGTSWSKLSAPDVTDPGFYYGGGSTPAGDQGFYDLAVAVDPQNPQVVYLAGIGLSVSTNGGQTWSGAGTACVNGNGCSLGGSGIHPDFHALTFDSSGNLFIGNDGGIYELPAADAATGNAGASGQNYVDLNTNQQTVQFYPGISQYGDAATVFGGVQDNGSPETSGTSVQWSEAADGAGDGGETAIDPANSQIQYATAQGDPYNKVASDSSFVGTQDAWADGQPDTTITAPTATSANFVMPFIIAHPASTLSGITVYLGAERPYKSTNGGQTWTALKSSYAPAAPNSDSNDVSALAAAPSNSNEVLSGWGDGTLQISTNGGTSWKTITPPQEVAGTDTWITHIAVDPSNANHVVVTFSGFAFPQSNGEASSQPHVVETTNATAASPTWTDITGTGLPGAPTNSAVFDGTLLIVATDAGVYSAVPNGTATSWAPLGASLPFAQVDDLSLSADGTTLIAGTHGRGAWKLLLPTTDHSLIVDGLRLSGPGGAGDQYVELFNTSPVPVNLHGWALQWQTSTGSSSLALPSRQLQPGGHFLVGGPNYSLAGAAAADATLSAPIPASPGGVQLLAPDSTVSDAVGYTTASPAYREGTGLSPVPTTSTADWAYVRDESNGQPVNTQNNASDFQLVAVGGPASLTGSAFGAPDPADLASPLTRNYEVSSALLDPTQPASAPPNRVYNATTKTLTVRRTLTNTSTSATVTTLDLLLPSISVAGGPGPSPHAQLRALNGSGSATVSTSGGNVTVYNLPLNQPPSQPNGGGMFSSLSVPLPAGGLAPGQSMSVAFQFAVDQGGSYWFQYDAMALP